MYVPCCIRENKEGKVFKMSMIYWQQLERYYEDVDPEILTACLSYVKTEKHLLHTTLVVGRRVQGLKGFPARPAISHLT